MNIGHVLRGYRLHREISLRDLAKIVGVSASTLSRLETGENCDAQTLAKVLLWLMSSQKEGPA